MAMHWLIKAVTIYERLPFAPPDLPNSHLPRSLLLLRAGGGEEKRAHAEIMWRKDDDSYREAGLIG